MLLCCDVLVDHVMGLRYRASQPITRYVSMSIYRLVQGNVRNECASVILTKQNTQLGTTLPILTLHLLEHSNSRRTHFTHARKHAHSRGPSCYLLPGFVWVINVSRSLAECPASRAHQRVCQLNLTRKPNPAYALPRPGPGEGDGDAVAETNEWPATFGVSLPEESILKIRFTLGILVRSYLHGRPAIAASTRLWVGLEGSVTPDDSSCSIILVPP